MYECENDDARAYMMFKTLCRFFLLIITSHHAFNQKIVSRERAQFMRICNESLAASEKLREKLMSAYEMEYLDEVSRKEAEVIAARKAAEESRVADLRRQQEQRDFAAAEALAQSLKDLTPSPPPAASTASVGGSVGIATAAVASTASSAAAASTRAAAAARSVVTAAASSSRIAAPPTTPSASSYSRDTFPAPSAPDLPPPSAPPAPAAAPAPAPPAAQKRQAPVINQTLRPIHVRRPRACVHQSVDCKCHAPCHLVSSSSSSPFLFFSSPLPRSQLPSNILADFYSFAASNTESNIETCGILCGRFSPTTKDLWVTHVVIPNQTATSDTCCTTDEEQLIEVQTQLDLLCLGWIHTHPSQTCFLSSIDFHTHFSYQLMLNESVAIVLAPKHSPNSGVFHCTLAGMKALANCGRTGFHKHEEPFPLYAIAPHYRWEDEPKHRAQFIDLRPKGNGTTACAPPRPHAHHGHAH